MVGGHFRFDRPSTWVSSRALSLLQVMYNYPCKQSQVLSPVLGCHLSRLSRSAPTHKEGWRQEVGLPSVLGQEEGGWEKEDEVSFGDGGAEEVDGGEGESESRSR